MLFRVSYQYMEDERDEIIAASDPEDALKAVKDRYETDFQGIKTLALVTDIQEHKLQ